jgi:hypothetical protein
MILQIGIAVDAVVPESHVESHARAGAATVRAQTFWMDGDKSPRSMKILIVGRQWPPQDVSVTRKVHDSLTITTKGIVDKRSKFFFGKPNFNFE